MTPEQFVQLMTMLTYIRNGIFVIAMLGIVIVALMLFMLGEE